MLSADNNSQNEPCHPFLCEQLILMSCCQVLPHGRGICPFGFFAGELLKGIIFNIHDAFLLWYVPERQFVEVIILRLCPERGWLFGFSVSPLVEILFLTEE